MKFQNPYTLKEVAEILGAEFEGDKDFKVTGINEIHKVEFGDITFVDHPKYYLKALKSKASVVIINKKVNRPDDKMLIFSKDPFTDYNKISRLNIKFVPSNDAIDKTAKIGEGTIIQPGTFIGNNVEIGKNCLIHANVSIYHHTIIGNNTIIHSGTVIGSDAFYYKRRPEGYDKLLSCGRVIIESNVEIGSNCTIDRGVSSDTILGEGTKLDNLIHIAHDVVVGKNCLIASQVGIAGVVTLEDNVILWGQVGVQKDLTIKTGAIVLGQSGVAKTLEANKVYFGSPAIEAKKKMKELVLIKNLPNLLNNSQAKKNV
ncbi:MAG: UDP-3-O-(3-hydroxymyristoyl)glucosamine N-acyltransferase [Bacteroidetes bacterium GWA2_31_9]|nr:MAG: UDP-3-O-(3-hydroxymyristoyl)glucosamine N-acyltransferase [Bacteroidetes bacterium GWA2_31_9]